MKGTRFARQETPGEGHVQDMEQKLVTPVGRKDTRRQQRSMSDLHIGIADPLSRQGP
jgi:hypothetical protein